MNNEINNKVTSLLEIKSLLESFNSFAIDAFKDQIDEENIQNPVDWLGNAFEVWVDLNNETDPNK